MHRPNKIKNITLALLCALLFSSFLAGSVLSSDLDEAKKLNSQAKTLYEQGRYKEAVSVAQQVLSIQEKALGPDHPITATGLNNLAFLYDSLGDYAKAEPLYKRALAIWEKALGPDHPDTATSLNNLAALYRSLGDYAKAEPLYKRSLAIWEKALGPDHPNTALSLNNLASLYESLGDYAKAEPLYKRSLAIKEKALGPDHRDTARSLNNLALLYESLGDYAKAEPLYKRSLAIWEKALGPDHPDTATGLNNLAALYRSLGDYAKAEPLLKKSLAIREKALGPDHPDTSIILNNLGLHYNSLGDYAKAELFYKRTLAIREKAFGPDHPSTAHILNNLAFLYLDTERVEAAYTIFKKRNISQGLGKYYLIKKDFAQAEREFLRSLEYTGRRGKAEFLIADHIGLGLAYEGLGNYTKAKGHLHEAIKIIEGQWQTLPPQAKKNFFSGEVGVGFTRLDPYEGLVRILIKEKGRDAGRESLIVAEGVKGRLFREMLAARTLKGKTSQDEAILRRDREFQQALPVLRKRVEVMQGLKIAPPEQEIKALKEELSRKEKEYETFIEEVKLGGSEVSSLLSAEPLSLPRLQSQLDPATTILEYFTARDRTYAWLISKNDIKAFEIPLKEKDLKDKVDTLLLPNISDSSRKAEPVMVYASTKEKIETNREERAGNRQHFSQSVQAFYRDLISPVEKDIKTGKLIIVPHGVLHKVPFSALSDGRKYLIDKYAISVLPAAGVLEYVVKKRKPGKDRLLTLANPKTDHVPLGFAEKEGKTLAAMFPENQTYYREKATETLVKNKATDFDIIHFASHGEFNDRQPMQSGLLLAKDDENDGYLQVHELFGLDLKNANLVTLSACDTALSKIQGGDDLVGLSRGFIYAGTPSILATLWQVDDASTAKLMEFFYKNWNKGMSKPEALRQAQIALKSIPQYKHPFYWAPFVMIGDWR